MLHLPGFSNFFRRSAGLLSRGLLCAAIFGADHASAVSVAAPTSSVLKIYQANSTTPAASTIAAGTPVTLSVSTSFNGSSPVPNGQVVFCESPATTCTWINALGIAQITADHSARLTLIPGIGQHTYLATFLGVRGTYAASTSGSETITVTGTRSTKVDLTSTGSQGNYSLSAKVSGTGPTFSSSDQLVFKDVSSNNQLGAANVTPGAAAIALKSSTLSTGTESSDAVSADFNNDGKVDLAIESSGDVTCRNPTLTIQLGDGDGTFTTKTTLTGPQYCTSYAVGDFNNDGKADIVVGGDGSYGSNPASLLLGNGDGTFSSVGIPDIGNWAIVVGDFNGDGNADILSAGGTLLLGNGSGAFTSSTVPALASHSGSLAVGDFNGDGKLDVAATLATGGSMSTPSVISVFVLTGNGDGTFTQHTDKVTDPNFQTNFGYRNLVTGDFNGDGKLDAAVVGYIYISPGPGSTDAVVTLMGDGSGGFSSVATTAVPATEIYGSNSSSLVAADFNGDGKLDVASLFDESNVVLSYGNGDGTFTTGESIPAQGPSSPDVNTLILGDVDNDGVPDVIAVNSDSGYDQTDPSLVVLTQRVQSGTATLTGVSVIGLGAHNVQASYAGNSAYEASTSSAISLQTTQVTTTLTLTAAPAQAVYGSQIVLSAKLTPSVSGQVSADGNNNVTFLNSSQTIGTASLQTGVATLNLTSLPVGANSITARYAGDANFSAATSTATTVTITAPPVPPTPTLTPSSLNFSGTTVGSVSVGQTITVQNTGGVSLSIQSVAATGDFAQTNTCGTSLPAGASCTVSVIFAPTAVGARTGTLTITDNAASPTQTVALSGTGVAPTITIAAPDVPAGGVVVSTAGTGTINLTFTPPAGFSGAVAVTCRVNFKGTGTASHAPTCAVAPSTVNITGGKSGTAVVTLTTGPQNASLQPIGGVGGIAVAGLLLGVCLRGRRLRGALVAVLCTAILGLVAGCGGSSQTSTTTNATTAGSYSVTITATAGSTVSSTDVPFTVQ